MQYETWEDIPLEKFRGDVFHLQRRIFSSSQRGDRKTVHRLQKLLLRSFSAKCIAVARVAEDNKGKHTAGVDGIHSLTSSRKLRLIQEISLNQRIDPVRRTWIDKPGTAEKRPLGIPAIKDRALQALIAMALEPEWEPQFGPGMYGFRKGRCCHDAIHAIRRAIQFSPRWVLDADIEKFFDRVDHDALIQKLETFPALGAVIKRILKSGCLDGREFKSNDQGTPQGGVLSPVLANIVLCGLEDAITSVFPDRIKLSGKYHAWKPQVIMYADDLVILHEDQDVIHQCKKALERWLEPLGLRLHPVKTRVVHTLENESHHGGFDFLGHHIQQFRTGKYAVKPAFKQVYTHITPSRKATDRIYSRAVELIDELLSSPACGNWHQERNPPEKALIHSLNRTVRGWCNFFKHANSKRAFSRLDSLLWWKLWRKLIRRHKKQGRQWVAEQLFGRQSRWQLSVIDRKANRRLYLRKFAETAIERFVPVQKAKSFYDGDFVYWASRQGHYPGLDASTGLMLKRQSGWCSRCHKKFNRHDHLATTKSSGTKGPRLLLTHNNCDHALRR